MLLPFKLDKNLTGNLALPAMAFGISLLLSSHPTTVLTSFPMSIRRQFLAWFGLDLATNPPQVPSHITAYSC